MIMSARSYTYRIMPVVHVVYSSSFSYLRAVWRGGAMFGSDTNVKMKAYEGPNDVRE
jgi:hypothetical protein